jgi:hypothetical protein
MADKFIWPPQGSHAGIDVGVRRAREHRKGHMTIAHSGLGCDATLDVDAGTVTLVHSGLAAKAHKRDASPRVILLGSIESVDFAKTNLARRGWV